MPIPDPTPSPRRSAMRRFWRIFRLLILLAVVIAALAVVLVSRGDPALHINMMIATFVGVFMTMIVGTGLMTLVFISNSSGHDEAAANFHEEQEEE